MHIYPYVQYCTLIDMSSWSLRISQRKPLDFPMIIWQRRTWRTWKAPLPLSNCLSIKCLVVIFLIESIMNRTVSKRFNLQEKLGRVCVNRIILTSDRACDTFKRDNSHSLNLKTSQIHVQWRETGDGKSLLLIWTICFNGKPLCLKVDRMQRSKNKQGSSYWLTFAGKLRRFAQTTRELIIALAAPEN